MTIPASRTRRPRNTLAAALAIALGSTLSSLAGAQAPATDTPSSATGAAVTSGTASQPAATRGATTGERPSGASAGSNLAPQDQALRDTLVSTLSADPDLKGAALTITVEDGNVRLGGTARSEDQAVRARALAENVAGSDNVRSDITTR